MLSSIDRENQRTPPHDAAKMHTDISKPLHKYKESATKIVYLDCGAEVAHLRQRLLHIIQMPDENVGFLYSSNEIWHFALP
jgi:hypothetical protein